MLIPTDNRAPGRDDDVQKRLCRNSGISRQGLPNARLGGIRSRVDGFRACDPVVGSHRWQGAPPQGLDRGAALQPRPPCQAEPSAASGRGGHPLQWWSRRCHGPRHGGSNAFATCCRSNYRRRNHGLLSAICERLAINCPRRGLSAALDGQPTDLFVFTLAPPPAAVVATVIGGG
jgi:hypothetical protein